MVDSKIVISQTQNHQIILHNIHVDWMSLSDSFQVAAIIEKLPPTWKDFKNYLKHKHKEMNLEELIVRLMIEEDYHGSEKKSASSSMGAKANIVEQNSKTKGSTMVKVLLKDRMVLNNSRASATIVVNHDIVQRIVASQRTQGSTKHKQMWQKWIGFLIMSPT